jgi:predicted alpha/beta superfamily hydrolase
LAYSPSERDVRSGSAVIPFLLAACAGRRSAPAIAAGEIPLGVTGTVRFHQRFPSRFVAARNVEVWLPPAYHARPRDRYPVLYVHDGQNVFAPATSFVGVDWGLDETMTRLVAERRIRPAVVVAIWHSADRTAEYLPRKALTRSGGTRDTIAVRGLSDAYLRFLVEELKPYIDSMYRTLPSRDNTFLMGSSMGGLISLYGVLEYPQLFGGAACLSTHWPAGDTATVAYLPSALPKPGNNRFYFDHGTATLDSVYPPLQARVDSAMRTAGYAHGVDWTTRVFPGADHSERSWRNRVSVPLIFLLGR